MSWSLAVLLAASSQPALRPQEWRCIALDNAQGVMPFSLVTDASGAPVELSATAGPLANARSMAVERLKHPTDIRFRAMTVDRQVLVRLSDPKSDQAVVTVEADLGSEWPYERMLARGVCQAANARATAPALPDSKPKNFYALWFVRLVDSRKKPVDAQWTADCSIVDTKGAVVRLPIQLTMSDDKMKARVLGDGQNLFPVGAIELKGLSQQSRKTYNGKAGYVFTAGSYMEQNGAAEPYQISHVMWDIGGDKIAQHVAVYQGQGKQTQLLGAGTCRPITPNDLAEGLKL